MRNLEAVRRVEARLGNRVMGHGVYRNTCCDCGNSGGEGYTRFDGVFLHDECLKLRTVEGV